MYFVVFCLHVSIIQYSFNPHDSHILPVNCTVWGPIGSRTKIHLFTYKHGMEKNGIWRALSLCGRFCFSHVKAYGYFDHITPKVMECELMRMVRLTYLVQKYRIIEIYSCNIYSRNYSISH